jgi:hypothetical protein
MSFSRSDYDGDRARAERNDALACEQYAERDAAFNAGLISYSEIFTDGPVESISAINAHAARIRQARREMNAELAALDNQAVA